LLLASCLGATPAGDPLVSPEAFLELFADVLDGPPPRPEDVPGEADAAGEEVLEDSDLGESEVRGLLPPAAVLAMIDSQELGSESRETVTERITGGMQNTDFTSASEGDATTTARWIEHALDAHWPQGRGGDVHLSNRLRMGRLFDRDDLAVGLRHGLGRRGFLRVDTHGAVYRAKGDPSLPDHREREARISAGEEGSWALEAGHRRLTYEPADALYQDQETGSLGASGNGRWGELSALGRVLLERERFVANLGSDLNRQLREWSLEGPMGDTTVRLDASTLEETPTTPGLLDPFDETHHELTLLRPLSSRLDLEVAYSRFERDVGVTSDFLFDVEEHALRSLLGADLGGGWSGTLSYSQSTSQNKDKARGDGIPEPADDQFRRDWELSVHGAVGRVDASVSAYDGDTRHVLVQQVDFPNQSRRGYALRLGYAPRPGWRLEVYATHDEEDYPDFPQNDLRTQTAGFTLTRLY
jgi:hypothetical protein